MTISNSTLLRRRLEDRRARLRDAVSVQPTDETIVRLLGEVDAALGRFASNAYGKCLVCKESVDDKDLARNPLLEYCLCGLTPQQERALEHDLGLARRIQAGLLPDPDIARGGWETSYRYEPAGAVSGDYVDLWSSADDPNTVNFTVADVSGKGVAAALLMAHLQAAFRSLFGAGVPLADLVGRVNQQLLAANLPAHYATLATGRASPDGAVEIVNAGHCPPLLLRGARTGTSQPARVETLAPTGLPVGILDERPYGVTRVALAPGDALVLYTDGVTEAERADGEMFDDARLVAALAGDAGARAAANGAGAPALAIDGGMPGARARGIVHDVRAALEGFLEGSRVTDDLTLAALVRT